MTETQPGSLIGIPAIAKLASVGPSAVSNWRQRHVDFPAPRMETPSGFLFDLGEVQNWLVENGKVSTANRPQLVLWHSVDALRATWSPRQVAQFLISSVVYFAATSHTDARIEGRTSVEQGDMW